MRPTASRPPRDHQPLAHQPSRRRLLAGAVGLGMAAVVAPGAGAAPARPKLVATTAHVADLLRAVAGERAEVAALLGEGIDPHTYKPTRSDMARLMAADAIAYNGLLLEGRMTETLARIGAAGKPVFAIADLLPRDALLAPAAFEGAHDPHVWMDVALWAQALDGVAEQLGRLDPSGAEGFAANAAAYRAQLDRLHGYAGQVLSSIPPARRVLVTAHDAFGYLGRAYGVEVVGIQGLSTESEAGLRRVEEIVTLLVDRQIPAVFVETSVTDRNIRALIAGAAARGHQVEVGGSLFSDAMGAPGTYEGTYVGMIDHNVTTMARALGGTAPAGGFQGRLAQAR